MHEYGDCSFCGGPVKEKKVELDYRYRGKLYIFQDVPTGVCRQCGEKYITADVAKVIERRIRNKEKWQRTVAVPVEVFSQKG